MKRLFAILLSIILVATVFPITAFAGTEVNDSSNLKLRWFSTDNVTLDASGNGRTGNRQGTVNWEKKGEYYGATFSNSDVWYTTSSNLMSSGIASSVENGGAGTTIAFMAYVNSSTSSSPFFCIFNNNYNASGYKTLFSYAPNGGIVYTNSAGTAKYSSTSSIATGWHTIVIKFYSSKCMEIYCDKTQLYGEQSDFYDNHTFDIPNSIKVGVNRENSAYYSGAIRDFRIYNKNLDVNTVTDNLVAIAQETSLTIPTTGDTNFANQIASSDIKVSFVQPRINGIGIENVTGRNYYRNILYCSNTFVANSTKTKVNQNSTYGYIVMPSQTIVLYDGVTAPIIPVKASFKTDSQETGNYSYSTFASIYLPSTPAFSLDSTWIGLNTQNCDRTTGWPSNSGSTNELSTTDVRSGNVCQVQSYSYEIGFKNGLVMNSIPSSNPRTDIPFRFNQTTNESSTITSSGSIYYIDITGLKSKINTAKTQAIDIASKSNNFTSESYASYVNKTLALLNFDINANLQTTLGASNAVTRMNTAINNAINEYDTAYANLKKIEIAHLTYIDGTTKQLTYETGTTPTLPDSNTCVSNNDGTHYYLGWDNVKNETIDDVKHTYYTQTKTSSQLCIYISEVTQEPTCTKSKITTYTCLACRYSYTTEEDKLPHTMEYTDMQNGTHRGVCSACHELSTQVYEAHSFTNYVSNNNADCTHNATETAKCDKCSAQDTREIVNTALGHNLQSLVVSPTCTEKGYTKIYCTSCDYNYIDENSFINPLGHSYVSKIISEPNCVANGIVEYTCKGCNNTYTEYTPTNNNHANLIYARTVAPTDTEDGFDIYYCSNLCGYWEKKNIVLAEKSELLESYVESYNSAKSTIITDLEAYTTESIEKYQDAISSAIANAEIGISNRDIIAIDNATKTILEASSLLRIKALSIEITIDGQTYENITSYGDVVTVNVSSMSKVTVEDNDITTVLCYTDESFDYVAKSNVKIEAYSSNKLENTNRITVLDKNDKVIAIYYGDISNIDIKAPKIPFYTFSHWMVIDEHTVKAEYKI